MSAPVDCEPLTASVPDQAPEAVHEVALVDDQLKVELVPLATVLGLAVRVTVGAGWAHRDAGRLRGAAAGSRAGERVGRVGRDRAR